MKNKGITLVALVITIVVLLILAGVSINLVLGENGLINNAKEAKNKTLQAEKDEDHSFDTIAEFIKEESGQLSVNQVDDKYAGDISDNNLRSGTEENPYIINSIEDLIVFASDVTNGNTYEEKYVKLGTDLDFSSSKSYVNPYRTDYGKYGYNGEIKGLLTSETGFKPIGTINHSLSNSRNYSFAGYFDGQDHVISNLLISEETQSNNEYVIGLFAKNYGEIKNIRLNGISINVSRESASFCGGIVGYNYKKVDNCSVYGDIKVESAQLVRIGGVVGSSSGDSTITKCKNFANINVYKRNEKNYSSVGGICGTAGNSVSKCINNGKINVNTDLYDYVGGITGVSDYCTYDECSNRGEIEVVINKDNENSSIIGGILGYSLYNNIENCNNIKDIKVTGKNSAIGGISGNFIGTDTVSYNLSNLLNIGKIYCDGESCKYGNITRNMSRMTNIGNCYYDSGLEGTGIYNVDDSINNIKKIDDYNTDEFISILNNGKNILKKGENYPIFIWE